MYITPHFARFRTVALVCWVLAAWFIVQGSIVGQHVSGPVLTISIIMLACILTAVGIAFWPLSRDRRAGIMLDSKGMLLNLSHCAAFIAWENIEQIGVSKQHRNLLALGSRQQIGIMLHDVQPYMQSYEERMPAAAGLLGGSLRRLALFLRPCHTANDASLAAQLANCKAAAGYDVLIPEAFMGGKAEVVIPLLEQYRRDPLQRQVLTL
jgi:hypothetical protein